MQTDDINILVDPTLPVEQTEALLQLHAGLGREDIHIVYATHYHGDHRVDADKYPNAKQYMSAASLQDAQAAIEEVRQGRGVPAFVVGLEDFLPAPEQLAPGVTLYPLPGHTDGNTGLMLTAREGSVLLAGDTIMGEEYFCAGEGYWFNTSAEKTHESIVRAARDADIVVPGHGDIFLTEGRSKFAGSRHSCWWYRLNLGSCQEESVALVRVGNCNVLINPSLPGHILRQALYDRTGLDPADITHVLCLDGKAKHRLDVETLKNAAYLMPAGALEHQKAAGDDIHLALFYSWSNQIPELAIEDGICFFDAPEGTVAVTTEKPSDELLDKKQVKVLLCGNTMIVRR